MNLYHYHNGGQLKIRKKKSNKGLENQKKKLSSALKNAAKKILFYKPYKNLPYAVWPILDWNILQEKKSKFVSKGYWGASKPFTFESSKKELDAILLLGHPSLKKGKKHDYHMSQESIFSTTCSHGYTQFDNSLYYLEPAWTDEQHDHMVPLITTLTRIHNPLIRYRLDAFLLQKNESCDCNKDNDYSYRLIGQATDILYVPHLFEKKLLPLYPDQIDSIIKQFPSIQSYQIVQQSTDRWKLRLQTENLLSYIPMLKQKFQSCLLAKQMKCPEILVEEISHKEKKVKRKIIKIFL